MLLRKRVLKAALKEFMRHGYSASTIEGVARTAGVSRTTIYALYSNKATLFGGLIRATVRNSDINEDVAFDDRPPAIVLAEAMRQIHRQYYRDPNLRLIRLCIGEVDRFPELIADVRVALNASLDGLVSYLRRLRDEGKLRVDDCEAATRLLAMGALGSMRPLFIQTEQMSEAEASGHLDTTTAIIVHGLLRDPA